MFIHSGNKRVKSFELMISINLNLCQMKHGPETWGDQLMQQKEKQ